ncbi:MAG: sensor histidine kinase [Deltaproteobacteria bacterium]|nr:MAG: sensor histidine kinase [Deltaproteobacteria bacterium]
MDAAELLRLRWVAVAGEILSVALLLATRAVGAWWILAVVVAASAASNLALTLSRKQAGHEELASLLALDIVVLTALLLMTGGALSPFTPLYLVFPVLASLFLTPAMSWAIYAFVLVCYGSLVVLTLRLGAAMVPDTSSFMHSHMLGLYVAVGLASPFLVSTILRTRRELARADRELAKAREAEAQHSRLAALATLAAGAAHELSSPLGTIAVAARELARRVETARPEARKDIRLIQAEVARCRQVLDELSADVGAGRGEDPRPIEVGDLLDMFVHDRPQVEVLTPEEIDDQVVVLPPRMVSQAVRRLIGNALDAADGAPVRLDIRLEPGHVEFIVSDEGPGIPPEILAHVGEPFFSTKPAGQGRGLGLWFVRSVAANLGGSLTLDSEPGRGTVATLRVPLRTPPEGDMEHAPS